MSKRTNILSKPQPKSMVLDDGKQYLLSPFTLNKMVELEDKFDKSWDDITKNMSAKVLRYLVYICLRDNHPELTEDKVGELLTSEKLMEIYKEAIGG